MFFPRLRRQAKWVFLFLALVFAIGFVGFGVGAGGIGLGNVLEGVADDGVPSVSEAEKRVSENPRDAQAFRELAEAQQADGNTDGAIEALESFVQLKPRNTEVLRQLAGLYLLKSDEAQTRASEANARSTYIAPGATVASTILIDGKPLDPDPISSAVNQKLSAAVQTALGEAQQASASAVATYQKLVAVTPKDPSVQLELADAATTAGDTATAIKAYKAFLRIAPTDPTAVEVRRILKQLQAQASSTPTG